MRQTYYDGMMEGRREDAVDSNGAELACNKTQETLTSCKERPTTRKLLMQTYYDCAWFAKTELMNAKTKDK